MSETEKLFDINVYIVYNVYMPTIQYTIRNIPEPVDQALRKRAAQSGKSFNQTVIEALNLQVFDTPSPPKADDFAWLRGVNTLDSKFGSAIADISAVDEQLWH